MTWYSNTGMVMDIESHNGTDFNPMLCLFSFIREYRAENTARPASSQQEAQQLPQYIVSFASSLTHAGCVWLKDEHQGTVWVPFTQKSHSLSFPRKPACQLSVAS